MIRINPWKMYLIGGRLSPRFRGERSEYKSWKGQLDACRDDVKFPSLEISLTAKAIEVKEDINRTILVRKNKRKEY